MKKFILPVLIMTSLLISCNEDKKRSDNTPSAPLVGDITLPQVPSGKIWRLSSILGKKTVLLAFYTTWCPYCKQSMPYLQDFYEKNRDKKFEVIGIDIEEPEKEVAYFVKKYGLTFKVLLAQDASVIKKDYPVRFLPTLFLINKQGNLHKRYEGFHPSILDDVTALLEKNP
ncbi:peroxiredoxin family protein [Elusimicrobiota bacterium]